MYNRALLDKTTGDEPPAVRFLLWPTRSLSWVEAQRIVMGFGVVALVIGVIFFFAGFPLILPFCGAEIAALWFAFYFTFKAAEDRQTITFTPDEVVVEKGRNAPEIRAAFHRHWVRIRLEEASGRLHPKRLVLSESGRGIEIGEFLSETERGQLAKDLIRESGAHSDP